MVEKERIRKSLKIENIDPEVCERIGGTPNKDRSCDVIVDEIGSDKIKISRVEKEHEE